MKKGSTFINTSRGEIVNEKELTNRLKKGDIFACLDVFSNEPLDKKSELRKLKNVFLTSHIAGSTPEMYENADRIIAKKISDCLNKTPISIDFITKEKFKKITLFFKKLYISITIFGKINMLNLSNNIISYSTFPISIIKNVFEEKNLNTLISTFPKTSEMNIALIKKLWTKILFI